MKEKIVIYQGDPCAMRLDDPNIQTAADVRARAPTLCRYYRERTRCSPPRFECVRVAGLKVARYLLEFYSEATEQTLALELEEFRRRAALPPREVQGFVDTPDYDYRLITGPELVVERVKDYARKVLDLKPGERVPRSPEESVYLDTH